MAIIHNLVAKFRADTGAFDRNVNKSRTHMTRFGKDIQMMGRQMLMLAGVGGGLYAVKRGLGYITQAAKEQEKVERLLAAATKVNITQYKNYAAELQRMTIYGDEQILSQMAYAKNLGVTNDKLEDATKAAIGLAAKFRLDLATSMMLVGRASQGQTQMLTRYGIVLSETLSSEEKFNALLKIGADSFRLAEEEARTAAGTWDQFKNAIGDVAENLGGPFVDYLTIALRKMLEFRGAVEKPISLNYPPLPEGWSRGTPIEGEIKSLQKYEQAYNEAIKKGVKPPTYLFGKIIPAEEAKTDVWGDFSKNLDETNLATAKSITQIRDKYIPLIQKEIEVTGRIGEAHYHAAKMVEFENAIREAGLKDTEESIGLMKKMKDKLKELEGAQRLARIADTIGESFTSNFEQAIFEAKKARDVINSVLRDIAMAVMRYKITEPLGLAISGAIGEIFNKTPATTKGEIFTSPYHKGGIVGQVPRTRRVSPAAFLDAPRLHGGLRFDEYPAILQRGEEVIPRSGGGGAAPTIIINNQTGQKMRLEREPIYDGKQWVIKVVAEDIQQGGALRKMFQTLK